MGGHKTAGVVTQTKQSGRHKKNEVPQKKTEDTVKSRYDQRCEACAAETDTKQQANNAKPKTLTKKN